MADSEGNYPLIEVINLELIPLDRLNPTGDLVEILSRILLTRYEGESFDPDPGGRFEVDLSVVQEATFTMPGLDGVSLVFGGATEALVTLGVKMVPDSSQLTIKGGFRIRFPREWLRPVKNENGQWVDDPSLQYAELSLSAGMVIDQDWNVTFEGTNEFRLTPSMIADSGFVIEGTVAIDLSESKSLPETLAMGLGNTWRGVVFKTLTLHLPDDLRVPIVPEDIMLTNFHIGSGGISGSVNGNWTPVISGANISGSGAGTLLGMSFGLKKLQLGLLQNAITAFDVSGMIVLPFFDHALDVELGFDLNGNICISIDSRIGIPEFTVSPASVDLLHVNVEHLTVALLEGALSLSVSGKITPLFGDLDWPTFYVQRLTIDSHGDVRLEGGWLDLPNQYSLDFHGFKIEITKLGFGKTEDGGKWIGFSGGVKLVDGFSAGASVEGLRVIWYDDTRSPKITLEGVGVEFEVPEVLRFKGEVSYHELPGNIHRFDGDIKLDLISLDLEIDATLVIGTNAGNPFFAIYAGLELPAGIPLWATGLALYGMAGLFAIEMEPNKHADESWYENPDGKEGWYKRDEVGVTDLKHKWEPKSRSLALGAGVTIGTLADNGFTFSGRVLLAIVFPGPILLIEGKASLLKERAGASDDPNFRALAVLDNRAGTFSVGLDAQYKFGSGGELIELHGGAEAFVDFHNASLWHLYLGQEKPREKRIRAQIFKLFEANSYFMLDANKLALGTWVGYDKSWKFGPLHVTVEAWVEGNAVISWKPVYFHGDLWLHGKAELTVFGFGLGLSVDARFAVDVFDPLSVKAELSVAIKLPWPLGSFDATIELAWTDEPPDPPKRPPLPLPLKEIAIEHFKVTTSWPLPRVGTPLLLPNYDTDADGFRNHDEPADILDSFMPADLPVVPLDCRPHITFGRAVHDDALVGVNPQDVLPSSDPRGWEWIGDPEKNLGPVRVRYGLKEVELYKRIGDTWASTPVARKAAVLEPGSPPKWIISKNPLGVRELFGSWAPVPQLPLGKVTPGTDPPVSNVKLWLWSRTPFDYTRHSGRAWDEWFTDRFNNYPCIPALSDRQICCDFEKIDTSQQVTSPWECPEHTQINLSWPVPSVPRVTVLGEPIKGLTHALCFPSEPNSGTQLEIHLLEPVKSISIVLTAVASQSSATGFDKTNKAYGPFSIKNNEIVIVGEHLELIRLQGSGSICILRICATIGPTSADVAAREAMAQHIVDELARWHQEGETLEPHTTYRLRVVTTLETQGFPDAAFNIARNQTEFAYFRTEGPPGLTELSPPIGSSNTGEFNSGLNDLNRYVRQTIPATVPASGEKPPLPRPVYRAYDVGVEFNEDYVDLMYRMERRDLGLYLYDNNNRPVRDAQGRLVVLSNRWGKTEDLTLTESEKLWITLINKSHCNPPGSIDVTVIPHDKTLTSAGEGQVLEADTVYEARLVPLLLHEAFESYSVGSGASGPAGLFDLWSIKDPGESTDGPSRWEVREEGSPASRYITQTSNIWAGSTFGDDPVKPGTMLVRTASPALPATHPDRPENWTDYRLSVYLRSTDDDAIGVVFRYQDSNNYYRFSMDRERAYRRLVRVLAGIHTILAKDEFVYRNQDYLITVEAVGPSLRVYQDGAPIFDVTDNSLGLGGIGLYCWANKGARFSDVRVDDFRKEAPSVYRFKFTTSRFTNFFHHLHSFQDETWHASLASVAGITAEATRAVLPASLPSEDEFRAYDSLATELLGPAAKRDPHEVQVTRVEHSGDALAFLVQTAEPIDWMRTDLEVQRTLHRAPAPTLPGAVKLTNVTFGATQPNEESVTLLLREATDLTRLRIEQRSLPGPIAEPIGDPMLFVEEFDGPTAGLLFSEEFGPNALDHYTILDESLMLFTPDWAVESGQIVQRGDIFGESTAGSVSEKPSTMAVTGSPEWSNMIINATLRSEDEDAIGVVFRYRDAKNYYRFSMDRKGSHRRLVKNVAGTFKTLWEDNLAYNLSQSYHLEIDAFGDRLLGCLDSALLFNVEDAEIKAGQVGFYSSANEGAHFEALSVEALQSLRELWQPSFADLSEITIVDEIDAVDGPSLWAVTAGALTRSSSIEVVDTAADLSGSYAVGGSSKWQDVQISARLRSDSSGAIGVMFRYTDGANYYLFSMDRAKGYRRLIKNISGTVKVLWQDAVKYDVGQNYQLALHAVGSELKCSVDGERLFRVYDRDLKSGRVALYCGAKTGASFGSVLVTDRTRRVGAWTIHDDGAVSVPSIWNSADGWLLQTSTTFGDPVPEYPGTYALTGSLAWTDYRLTVSLRSDKNGAIGVMFRYIDEDNYYRLSMDSQRHYHRLIRKLEGTVTTLWQDTAGYIVGDPLTLTIDAIGSRFAGYLGTTRLFDVIDRTHVAGQVGLYCWGNKGARFERVEVMRPSREAMALLRDHFDAGDTTGWTVVDEGTLQGPSKWSTFEGTYRQTRKINSRPHPRKDLVKKGTQALGGDASWTDVIVSAQLRSLEDDAIGLMFRYTDINNYYRFSMDSRQSYRRLVKNVGGSFTILWEDDFAYEVGQTYEVTIEAKGSTLRGFLRTESMSQDVPMFVVEDTDLSEGRVGLYCYRNRDARFSQVCVHSGDLAFDDWLLDDPFNVLMFGRWTFVDDGKKRGLANWEVIDGELRQARSILDGSTKGKVHKKHGTYALAGKPDWTDYRVSVRLLSDDKNAIGVMLRYQDKDNYYQFSMDKANKRRLVKRVAGEVKELWADELPYALGREYVVTLDCVGEWLTGYVDGLPLFKVEDSTFMAGRIALYCLANSGARFREVRVAAPVWSNYYAFRREVLLPAGTRVRLHAGNRENAPPLERGVVPHFIAALDERGRLQLSANGADLRLVASNGTIGHSRRFLPNDHHTTVGAKVLRKADGTGLFVLVPGATAAGTALVAGQYRLNMTYHRNNLAKDPHSQVFSEAGNKSDEHVTIDLPW
jgi:hypothetical protein